jgi:hypothetical protein
VDEAVDLEAAIAKLAANEGAILPVIKPIYVFRVERLRVDFSRLSCNRPSGQHRKARERKREWCAGKMK